MLDNHWILILHHANYWILILPHDNYWMLVLHQDSYWTLVHYHDNYWKLDETEKKTWYLPKGVMLLPLPQLLGGQRASRGEERPSTVTTEDNVDQIHDDRWLTTHHIANTVGMSHERVANIPRSQLRRTKVSARWVPKLLTRRSSWIW